MRMTFYTRSLEMAITITITMTQRTRNHSMEFLLSVTATTVTRKVMLLYHHCLLLLGWGEGAGHMLLRKQTCFPIDSLATGPANNSLCEHGATDQSREHRGCYMLGSAYSLYRRLIQKDGAGR